MLREAWAVAAAVRAEDPPLGDPSATGAVTIGKNISLDAAPLHAHDGLNLVLREKPRQLARYVLVEKYFQSWA